MARSTAAVWRAGLGVAGVACVLATAAAGGVSGYWFVSTPALAGWAVLTVRRRVRADMILAVAMLAGGAGAAGAVQPVLALAAGMEQWKSAVLVILFASMAGIVCLLRAVPAEGARATSAAGSVEPEPSSQSMTLAPEAALAGWLDQKRRRVLPAAVVTLSAVSTWWHLGLVTGWRSWGDIAPAVGLFLGLAAGSERSRALASGSILGLAVAAAAGGVGAVGGGGAQAGLLQARLLQTDLSIASRWGEISPFLWAGAMAAAAMGAVLVASVRTPRFRSPRFRLGKVRWRRWLLFLATLAVGWGLLAMVLPWVPALAASAAVFVGVWLGGILGRGLGFAVWPAAGLSLGLGVLGMTAGEWLKGILGATGEPTGFAKAAVTLLAPSSPAVVAIVAVVAAFVAGTIVSMSVSSAGAPGFAGAVRGGGRFGGAARGSLGVTIAACSAGLVLMALHWWWHVAGHPWGTTFVGGPDRTAFLARAWSMAATGSAQTPRMLGLGAAVGLAALLLPGKNSFFVAAGLLLWPGSAVWVLLGAWLRANTAPGNAVWRLAGGLLAGFGVGGVLAGVSMATVMTTAAASLWGTAAGRPWFGADVVLGVSLTLFLRELAGRRHSRANTSVGRTGQNGVSGENRFLSSG